MLDPLPVLPQRVFGTHLPTAFYGSEPSRETETFRGVASVPGRRAPIRFELLTPDTLEKLRDGLQRLRG